MASPLLGARDDPGQLRVERATARGRLPSRHGRPEQWVREAKAVAIQLDDPRGERLGQSGVERTTDDGLDEVHGRIGNRGNHARGLERRSAEVLDALAQKLVQVGGHRELLARCEHASSALERPRELEREERVAARGLPEPDQDRPREARVESGAQQLLEGAETETLDRHDPHLSLGLRAAEPARQVAADREQRCDRLVSQTCQRVPERRERGRVQPLDVVDRKADGCLTGEQSHRSEEGGGDRPVVGWRVRVPEQQRRLERTPSLR